MTINWNEVHKDARRALDAVAAKHGIAVRTKSGTYSSTNLTFGVELATITADGVVMSKQAKDFKANSHTFGIDAGVLGAIITLRGEEYRIVGLSTRSVKHPIILVKLSDNHTWKWSATGVKRALKQEDDIKKTPELLALEFDTDALLN